MPDESPQLRRAVRADAPAVQALLAAAGEALARQGFANWLPPYPLERLARDVDERDVYVVHSADAEVAATFTLAPTAARPYQPAPWPDADLPAQYLNRLAVAPALQGRGLGSWCLREIERLARAAGARAIRCDVLAANAVLRRFYERHGYVARGKRSHSGWTFACYERLLDP